jgi:hypothetical protein
VVPYSSTEEEEKEEDSFLNVLYESWGKNEDIVNYSLLPFFQNRNSVLRHRKF